MSENNFVKLGDVAHECRLTWSGGQTDIPIVGLEHLVPGEIELSSWDSNIEHTFSKKFLKGQVLLGRRRVYLKKAVVAPCDGICSGDITVIESTGGILPELLPFVIQNDRFFDYAMQGSAGSLSPRVKWEHLKNYEFPLPPLTEQKVLADKLWAAYRLKESYKKLLAATEEMVKSQFIEMFGSGNWPEKRLGEVGSFTRGGGFQKSDYVEHGIPCIHYGQIHTKFGPFISSHITEISSDLESKTKFASKGDVIIAITSEDTEGSCKSTAWLGDYSVAVGGHAAIYKHSMNPLYMTFFLHSTLFNHAKMEYVHGTKVFEIRPDDIAKILVPCPPISLQEKFATIAHQADKSGFDGRKSQFIEMFGNPLSSVQRYPLKKLGDCCEVNPRRPNLTLKDTDIVSFVPMPSVSENGYLQDVADEEYGKVKKGFTYFENNDVLFAKITPCMENGKGAIAEGLTNNIGMGSTEFHVLRPIEGVSSPYWLLALTRLPFFRERASKNMTGTGGQKRVPAKYLENFMVGLPPIEEQNRFENIYKQADKSGFELRKSIKTIDIVIKSLINKK